MAEAVRRRRPRAQGGDWREAALYERLREANAPLVQQLRVILQSAEARETERAWLKLKANGELDETRLVDAAVGERQVFKKRGAPPQRHGTHQAKPKHLTFLLDASASMARGDALDGRLHRMASTAALLIEALHGFEHKFVYNMSMHSGGTADAPLLEAGRPPAEEGERARVVGALFAHAWSAPSGDNSLQAVRRAVEAAGRADADERIVVLLSDANLGRYDVSPEEIGEALRSNPHVRAYCVFVAEPAAAEWLAEQLPLGQGFAVQDVAKLPRVMKEVFAHAATAGP